VLGIVAALEMERRWIVVAGGDGWPLVELSGPGAARARAAAQRLLARGASALASWGVAAGLDPHLAAGSVVLPRRVVVSDQESRDVDADWRRALSECLPETLVVTAGSLAHAPRLLETAAAKAELRERLGACAADMESAAVAAAAAAAAVPFLAVRVVLDDARAVLPPILRTAIDDAGRLRVCSLAARVMARPAMWSSLLRLVRSHAAARRAMRLLWRQAAPDLRLGRKGEPAQRALARLELGSGEP
jgi:adenosylhomocysteine nucleosidase